MPDMSCHLSSYLMQESACKIKIPNISSTQNIKARCQVLADNIGKEGNHKEKIKKGAGLSPRGRVSDTVNSKKTKVQT